MYIKTEIYFVIYILVLIFPQIEKKNTRLSKFQQSQKKFIRFAQSTFFLPNYIFGLRDQKKEAVERLPSNSD